MQPVGLTRTLAPRRTPTACGIFRRMPFARVAVLATLVACGAAEQTSPEVAPGSPATIRVVSGEGQTDSALAILAARIVVEVRDSAGRLVRNAPVMFAPLSEPGADWREGPAASFCSNSVVDSCIEYAHRDSAFNGQASAIVRLGRRAGTARVQVSLVETPLALLETPIADTATLTVKPGAPVRVASTPKDSSAYVGSSYRVIGRVFDQYGNERLGDAITFTGGNAAATASADGVFKAQTVGRAFAIARSGSLADTAWITVPPRGTIAAMEPGSWGSTRIVKVELDGSGLKRIAPVEDTYYGTQPDWISGSEVAFDSGGYNGERILVADTLGNVRRLTAPGTPTLAEGYVAGGPGGAVYFDAWGGGDYGTALWKVSAPGTMPVRIGPNPPGNANAWQATVAPDGLRLAYVDVNRGGLSILDIATGAMTPLNIAATTPRWSPAGDWIVFGAGGTLHLVHPDGTMMTDVAGARPFSPRADWSPDGAWLIVRSSKRLELINVRSGEILPLGWSEGLVRPVFRRQ